MEKPPYVDPGTGHDVDVSAESTTLRIETLNAIENAITHDALHGETLEQHHAAQTAFLRSLLNKLDAGKLEPNPGDSQRLVRFKKKEREIARNLKANMSQYVDMQGPHAERVRSYFEANDQSMLAKTIHLYKRRIMEQESATAMKTEDDVPQREDAMVAYLKKLGLALEMKTGQTDPKALARQIMGAFRRAKIDQNVGVLRELAGNIGVQPSIESEQDATFWATKMAHMLTDKPDKTNEMRRNWFKQAGMPSHPATTRAERSPSPALTTPVWEQVDTTAQMDTGTNLMAPKPKKGA